MVAKIEQFTELHRKNMEAAMRMAQMSIENWPRKCSRAASRTPRR